MVATAAATLAVAFLAACGATGSPSLIATASAGRAGGNPSSSLRASRTPDAATVRLMSALHALQRGYDFDALARVGGTTATEAKGRWIGGASEFVLTSGGRSVTYRSVPPDAWVQQGDGSWVATQGPVPGGDPLASFSSPLQVASATPPASAAASGSAASGATPLVLTVTYAAATLGVSGTDPVTVTMRLGTDGSITVAYATTTSAGAVTSTTTLTAAADRSPILAPGATPHAST